MRVIDPGVGSRAPAELIWDIVTRFDDDAAWNPFIQRIVGVALAGTQMPGSPDDLCKIVR
jgi:hypothetical protein